MLQLDGDSRDWPAGAKDTDIAARELATLHELPRQEPMEGGAAIARVDGRGVHVPAASVEGTDRPAARTEALAQADKVGARARRSRLLERKDEAAEATLTANREL